MLDSDTVVVGAGLTGLVVAHALASRGRRVVVLEREARPGGVLGTVERDGFLYETAANSALSNAPALVALIDALGLRAQRIETRAEASRRYVVRNGAPVALPMSPPALFASKAFSWRGKLALLREPFVARATSEESVAAFARRRLGREVLDYAVDPFVSGIHAADPERLSLPAAFPRLHAMEQAHGSLLRAQLAAARARRRTADAPARPHSFSFRRGMQTLTDALAAVARIELRAAVARVEQHGNRLRVVYDRDGAENAIEASSVVVATPAFATAPLIAPLDPGASQALGAIEHAPVAVVVSAHRRDDVAHPLDGFGMLAPGRERRRILGTLFSSTMFDGRAPAGHVLLTTFVGGRRDAAALASDDTTLATVVADELRALLGVRGALWTDVVRWPRAIPQYELGHASRVQRATAVEAAVPGVFLAGSWAGGVSIGDRVTQGNAVAETVDRYLDARPARGR